MSIYADIDIEEPPLPVPKRVLIIGGGPAGLVALRNLVERGQFEQVKLVERRDDIGGVWYFDDLDTSSLGQSRPRWPSPSYKGLIGNVLPEFLSFSEFPFPLPPSTPDQPFPTLRETHAYLRSFAARYSNAIKLNTEVVQVEELPWRQGWKVVSKDWSHEGQGTEVEEVWDAVVVAVGWYDHPVWPDTDGLDELKKRGLAKHAKWWRGPNGNGGKRALVIGNANSSNDIAGQLAPVAESPVYQSIRRPAFPGFPSLPDDRIKMVAPVVKYILKPESSHKIDAHLQDGTVLTDLDVVYVGTGYRPFPDFIKVFERPQLHSSPDYGYSSTSSLGSSPVSPRLIPIITAETEPHRIPHLHRLILYAPNPSLAFLGAPMTYTPFIIADVVSTYIAFTWLRLIPLPLTTSARLQYERDRLVLIKKRRQEIDNPSALYTYSVMGLDEEAYGKELREDLVEAKPELDKVLPVWSEERTNDREAMFGVKFKALQWAKERGGGGNVEFQSI